MSTNIDNIRSGKGGVLFNNIRKSERTLIFRISGRFLEDKCPFQDYIPIKALNHWIMAGVFCNLKEF